MCEQQSQHHPTNHVTVISDIKNKLCRVQFSLCLCKRKQKQSKTRPRKASEVKKLVLLCNDLFCNILEWAVWWGGFVAKWFLYSLHQKPPVSGWQIGTTGWRTTKCSVFSEFLSLTRYPVRDSQVLQRCCGGCVTNVGALEIFCWRWECLSNPIPPITATKQTDLLPVLQRISFAK